MYFKVILYTSIYIHTHHEIKVSSLFSHDSKMIFSMLHPDKNIKMTS